MRLDIDLVKRTLTAARERMTVEEIIDVMEIARPTFYAWFMGRTAPMMRSKAQFVRLCRSAKLKELREEWRNA